MSLATVRTIMRAGRVHWPGQTTRRHMSLDVPHLNAKIPYIWLRDSCQSAESVHPSTGQKLFRTSDIPVDIKPAPGGVSYTNQGISIQWVDGHKSFFTFGFLEHHWKLASAGPSQATELHNDISRIFWNKETISRARDFFINYSALESPSGLLAAVNQLCQYGLVFLRNVPHQETSDTRCELINLAHKLSQIRPTFYGDQVWNVKNVRNSKNIAYTNLDLGLHMDLLYFQHPPQYQALHCLRNRVEGGQSIFVDAIHAANLLQKAQPGDFDQLSETLVPFHYENDNHHLRFMHPTIELGTSSVTGHHRIQQINYSPPFQAPLPMNTPPQFYTALSAYSKILNSAEQTFKYTLAEGDAVIFDNRRVLHARTAFNDKPREEGDELEEANRWLKGCYLEPDTLWDKGRILRAGGVER